MRRVVVFMGRDALFGASSGIRGALGAAKIHYGRVDEAEATGIQSRLNKQWVSFCFTFITTYMSAKWPYGPIIVERLSRV